MGLVARAESVALRWIAIFAATLPVGLPSRAAADSRARTSSTTARPPSSERLERQTLAFRGRLQPILLDYELPGHPAVRGRGHAGIVGTASILWSFQPDLTIEAGVLGRLPFALDLSDEAGAVPIIAVTLQPFDEGVKLRFGTLESEHGFHPAIVDEARYAYGRNYEENYNRSLLPEAARDLGGDPFLPSEHGAQLIADIEEAHAEVFLDWQLLETNEHREKFSVGAIGEIRARFVDLGFQLRLVHYGGELFTKSDPIRFAGIDPVRQPLTLAFIARGRPIDLGFLTIEIPGAYLRGRMPQAPGEGPTWHHAFELGVDMKVLRLVRAGYALFLPLGRPFGFVSEDGDPVYSGRRAHRATLAISTRHGAAELSGRLDLVFADDASKVQYLTVTALTLELEEPLFPPVSPAPRKAPSR